MNDLSVVLWLLGYPASLAILRYVNSAIGLYDYKDEKEFSSGTKGFGELWTLAIWIGVAVWLKA